MTDLNHPIRVLVVDDDPMVVTGISTILSTSADLVVVGRCADGDEVPGAVASLKPDVVLCDVNMKRVNGIQVAATLSAMPDGPRVLMMTALDDDGLALDAITAGATGFLLKEEDPQRFIEAVQQVARGEVTFSQRAARQLTDWVRNSQTADVRRAAQQRLAMLTDREREFAVALMSGASDAELAANFFVAETTVKSALTSIKTKWGIRNRTQLAVVVAQAGV
ncbi:response regulator [Leifsonia sp. NPDC056824]|uniref:response regulator n=1 Tax=Leifsonia sp. NPDC056824 TaxID=3345953 RepID=UPI0036A68E8C